MATKKEENENIEIEDTKEKSVMSFSSFLEKKEIQSVIKSMLINRYPGLKSYSDWDKIFKEETTRRLN